MGRWVPKVHNEALRKLFLQEDGPDPERTDHQYIDEVYEGLDESNVLSEIEVVTFRKHYREKGVAFLMDETISAGKRRAGRLHSFILFCTLFSLTFFSVS